VLFCIVIGIYFDVLIEAWFDYYKIKILINLTVLMFNIKLEEGEAGSACWLRKQAYLLAWLL